MPVITFWSNNEKAIGQTVSAALAATVMAMEHNYKVLLVSADFNDHSIENCFGAQESNKKIVKSIVSRPQINLDSGINGLLKLADSNRVTPEIIHDYTKIIFKNRLEVLYSPTEIDENEKVKIMGQLQNIVENASRYYDYVFVDLKKGIEYDEQIEILKKSNVIVVNIEQGRKSIEKFFKAKQMEPLMNRVIWNICRYDNKSKYNTKNIERNLLRKQAIYETHYNTLIMEAIQEENVVEVLIRYKTLKEDDENLEFITKLQELTQGILLKYQETQTIM